MTTAMVVFSVCHRSGGGGVAPQHQLLLTGTSHTRFSTLKGVLDANLLQFAVVICVRLQLRPSLSLQLHPSLCSSVRLSLSAAPPVCLSQKHDFSETGVMTARLVWVFHFHAAKFIDPGEPNHLVTPQEVRMRNWRREPHSILSLHDQRSDNKHDKLLLLSV